jgi:hypothetical protein
MTDAMRAETVTITGHSGDRIEAYLARPLETTTRLQPRWPYSPRNWTGRPGLHRCDISTPDRARPRRYCAHRRPAAHRRRRQPERLHSETSLGKAQRHRLNRGGDRQANSALYSIVLSRLRWNTPQPQLRPTMHTLRHDSATRHERTFHCVLSRAGGPGQVCRRERWATLLGGLIDEPARCSLVVSVMDRAS